MTPDDIDALDHVNNSVYLRWTEAAVIGHWASLATRAEQESFRWIAVRHEIDFHKPAFLADRVSIETRITAIRRARAWYQTTISRGTDLLAEVVSCWCCIDSGTRRLTVIPGELAARFIPEAETVD